MTAVDFHHFKIVVAFDAAIALAWPGLITPSPSLLIGWPIGRSVSQTWMVSLNFLCDTKYRLIHSIDFCDRIYHQNYSWDCEKIKFHIIIILALMFRFMCVCCVHICCWVTFVINWIKLRCRWFTLII